MLWSETGEFEVLKLGGATLLFPFFRVQECNKHKWGTSLISIRIINGAYGTNPIKNAGLANCTIRSMMMLKKPWNHVPTWIPIIGWISRPCKTVLTDCPYVEDGSTDNNSGSFPIAMGVDCLLKDRDSEIYCNDKRRCNNNINKL